MRVQRTLATALLFGTAIVAHAGAMETDQYLAWSVELRDSSRPLNAFVNANFEQVLRRINRRRPELPCAEIPPRLYRHLVRSLFSSRIRNFAHSSPDIDRYPDEEVGNTGYLRTSIYRKPAFPFYIPMARTLRIGDVYLGSDKLGHLFSSGRRYYQHYRRRLRRGRPPEEAMRKAILNGVRTEKGHLGQLVVGVFSHADLEANYQGFRLARELCGVEDPYLERTDRGWRLRRPVDLRDYVNPYFDESFNNNHYSSFRWKGVRSVLQVDYCRAYRSGVARGALRRYRSAGARSFSAEVIAEYFAARGKPSLQVDHSLPAICNDGLPPTDRRSVSPVATSDRAAPVQGSSRLVIHRATPFR